MLNLLLSIDDPIKRDLLLELYLGYKSRLLSYALKMLNDQAAAEDILHDVFVKLAENPQILKYDQADKNAPYLYIMIKNRCLNYLSRSKKVQPVKDIEIAEEADFTEMLSRQETFQLAVQQIMALPDIYKDVLLLRFGNGLSDQEISEYLQISPDNVRVRICRALKSLQKSLAKEGEDHAEKKAGQVER